MGCAWNQSWASGASTAKTVTCTPRASSCCSSPPQSTRVLPAAMPRRSSLRATGAARAAAGAERNEIQVMLDSPVEKIGPVLALGVGDGEFVLVRMLSAPVECSKKRWMKSTYQYLSTGDWCFKARRLECVDEDNQLYVDQFREEVALIASVVDLNEGRSLELTAATHGDDEASCFKLPDKEHKRVLDSSLHEFVQKLS
mmetsp:Transcript_1569/g.3157  ORF Transcript_1569/g.3157 Transcript_1569/m.3157 type:complete len:199 (-) Transcript_1569:435-1031(-)